MKFASLHLHTEVSPLDSIASPENYVQRAIEVGTSAIGITDHGRLGGIPESNR